MTLTVLFTDIVGSTELLASLDARSSRRLLDGHLATLRDRVARAGGTEIKNLGDGLMVSFRSAEAATSCAVALQQACVDPPAGAHIRVSIRVGVSSGDVRLEGDDCFGTAVIEASRLCAAAASGQILVSDATRLLARDYATLVPAGEIALKGLEGTTTSWQVPWSPDQARRIRVLLADDAALVREGVARVLEEAGLEVVGQAGDAEQLIALAEELHPDIAVTDVRMPPTHTSEGLDAAVRLRGEHRAMGVLVLSQDIQPDSAARLLNASPTHVGYLLKERVTDLFAFADCVKRVAGGGTAFEPSVISDALGLEPGEGDVRELTAEEIGSILGERSAL